MLEVLQFAFSPENIVFTVLLIVILLYWISVIVGLLDISFLDFDLDLDMDADVDIDANVDAGGPSGGFWRLLFDFYSISDIPVMVFASIFILSMWTLCMIGNHLFNKGGSFWAALLIYLPCFIVTCGVAKLFIIPLGILFRNLEYSGDTPKKMIGQVCTVTTTQVSKNLGQAEIATNGSPILLNVLSSSDHVFHKGDEAVVVGKESERGVYFIAPLRTES